MKKILFLLISIPFFAFNQGGTDFEITPLTASYLDDQFDDGGITFFYNHSRDQDTFFIDGVGLMLRRASDSYLEWTVPNGIGELSFEYRKAYSGGTPRELEIIVNGVQVTTTGEFGAGTSFQHTVYTFTHDVNLSGSVDIKIKNVGTTTGNRQSVIDNLSWTAFASVPTCDAPTNLAIANIGETSAVASWTAGGLESEWLVVYGPTGFDFADYANNADVTEVTTSDNPYTIAGLDAETIYDVYVIAKCDATLFSDEIGPVAFTTEAATPPTCDAPTNLAIANIGETSAVASWTAGGSESEWLVVYGPTGFDFTDYANNTDVTEITTSANPYTIAGLDAETIYDVYVIAKCDATLFSDEIGPVAFTTEAATPPTCDTPTNLAIADIEETSAVASWTAGGSESEWLVVYGPTNFDFADYANNADVTEVTTSANPYTIAGLDAETIYDVYVIAKCDATLFSDEIGPVAFTTEAATPPTCDTPTNLAIADIEETSAVASWNAGGAEPEWLVVYGPTNFDFADYANNADVTEVTTSDNPYTIAGLDAETIYDVYVIAKCDATLFSDELGPETFTTKTSSLDKHEFAKFSFYPNPTQNELNLKSGMKIENVTVYDMLGKNILNISPNALTTKVNTQKLQKGVYIMSVTINGVQETYRVIKN